MICNIRKYMHTYFSCISLIPSLIGRCEILYKVSIYIIIMSSSLFQSGFVIYMCQPLSYDGILPSSPVICTNLSVKLPASRFCVRNSSRVFNILAVSLQLQKVYHASLSHSCICKYLSKWVGVGEVVVAFNFVSTCVIRHVFVMQTILLKCINLVSYLEPGSSMCG